MTGKLRRPCGKGPLPTDPASVEAMTDKLRRPCGKRISCSITASTDTGSAGSGSVSGDRRLAVQSSVHRRRVGGDYATKLQEQRPCTNQAGLKEKTAVVLRAASAKCADRGGLLHGTVPAGLLYAAIENRAAGRREQRSTADKQGGKWGSNREVHPTGTDWEVHPTGPTFKLRAQERLTQDPHPLPLSPRARGARSPALSPRASGAR